MSYYACATCGGSNIQPIDDLGEEDPEANAEALFEVGYCTDCEAVRDVE